ncbi:MAG TPA: hypothetical protein VJS41_00725 [Stellaceae bacterium]|nr:hypothetical protein [Stellaceae bacterium]
MADDQITVGVAADISDFSDGMAQASAAADATFGRIRASAQSATDGMGKSFAAGADQLTNQQQKLAASWIATFRPIGAAFNQSIAGMILGTTTWQKAVARIGQSIVTEEVGNTLKLAENWAATELAKTTATQQGVAARAATENASQGGFLVMIAEQLARWLGLETGKTAATGAGEATRAATQAATAAAGLAAMVARGFAQIEIDAAVAAAGAMAATAAIPIVGPELAPEVAAATYAATMGWAAGMGGGIASAEGGMWDVPGTILSVLHPEESVIPASVANPMRDFFSGGTSSGGAGGDIHIHGPLVSAIDTQTGAQFLKNNMRAIAKGLAAELRNFNANLTPAMNG